MGRLLTLLLIVAVAGCGSDDDGAAAPPTIFFEGHESAIYELDEHWMCRAGLAGDVCDRDLDTTFVSADGQITVVQHVVAADPGFDCFYIYPTVRLGSEGNAAFDGMYDEEIVTTRIQAARFGSICEVFAPLYRQRTLSAPADPSFIEIAYGDVVDAFRYYLGNLNQGRPFVLLGHSQGAGLLARLIVEEIDPRPELHQRMISALLLGATVRAPYGTDAGGSFDRVPVCRARDQFGCVVSYASFRDTVPPPQNSLFARNAVAAGLQAVCVNPAALGGRGALTPYFSIVESTQFGTASPAVAWGDNVDVAPEITTPFVALPGLVTAECVDDGDFHYLSLQLNADPWLRVDDIPGDLTPEWGMHLVDANVAMGELVDLVDAQAAAWFAAGAR